jgi:RecA/RadA recombinase
VADDRQRAVDLALSQIEKQFGKGSIMRLGSKEASSPSPSSRPAPSPSTPPLAWAGYRAAA